MTTDKFKYHVIWIDDKYKECDGFITNAAMDDIGVVPFEYGKDGIRALKGNLEYWDGVVLDVKCYYEEGDLDIADNFYKVKDELVEIKNRFRPSLPYFVYSAQPDILSDRMFKASLNGKRLYSKGEDDDKLISDIIFEANQLLENQIRQKYLSDIPYTELHKELTEILSFVERNIIDVPDPIEKCRLTLNWVMDYCHSHGLIPFEHNGSNLGECSSFLGKKEMTTYVPLHIQRSFHSCVEVSNNGSHREEVFNLVRYGKAPFLVRSTVFELLNILQWCTTIPQDEADIQRIKEYVSSISVDFSIKGEVQKDEFNNLYCEDCLITHGQVDKFGLSAGDRVLIRRTKPNSKKGDRSPYDKVAATIDKL